MIKKIHYIAMYTEILDYFCWIFFPGKFEKVTNARRPESTLHSKLTEFKLETLFHSITSSGAIKVRRETKLKYFIEVIQTDISTRGLSSEKSVDIVVLILLLLILNT